ncbi:MAG: ASCH domain-containing protein [Methylotenera sp.]|nr:ASCH domain-containing protein [Flavobacterium sp.]
MKTLSIKQPWASLIAHNIKNIENRTWKTKFRGRIFIHASAKSAGRLAELINSNQLDAITKKSNFRFLDTSLIKSAIIGEVEIIDCVLNHESIWAENEKDLTKKPIYNWVLANAVLYDKPILNVKGKLSFWEFNQVESCYVCNNTEEVHVCQKCDNFYCQDHASKYNQFTQIDYDCCENCSKS